MAPAFALSLQAKARLAKADLVTERSRGCLGLGVDAVAHRPTLHEDDRMVPVLAGDRGRQAENVAGLGSARDKLEADGREMVAFVDDEVAVVGHKVAHLAVAHQALDQGDVDPPARPTLAAADRADVAVPQPTGKT